ncbi:hypothetical protein [Mesorhizobium sp. M0491]|uniref:hypothetical protein n=1 Tax=Mesorhizobium sp. M0491 TaxID=2956950 RepID=UPI003336A3CE
MAMQDADVAPLTVLLSPERLGNLTQLTGVARSAIELHQETIALGASLMSVIATVEISLRNAICENLSQHFGVPNWLISPPAPFQWKSLEGGKGTDALHRARRAEYAKLTQQEKSALEALAYPNGRPANVTHAARAKARQRQIQVSSGKVIAEITFYFWKRLYSPDYEQSLWRPSLKRTFPDKKVKRAEVADHLENIYQARNRLAHHEPVLHKRFADTLASIKYIIERLEAPVAGPDTRLANLLAEWIAELEAQAQALHAKLDTYRIGPNGQP